MGKQRIIKAISSVVKPPIKAVFLLHLHAFRISIV